MKKEKLYVYLILVFIVILLGVFLYINTNAIMKHKKIDDNDVKLTTIKITTMETTTNSIIKDSIMIEGMEETFDAKIYSSHLGYSLKYQDDLFNISVLSNSSVVLNYINDDSNYIKIEKLNQNDYYDAYNNYSGSYSLDGYNYSCTFLRANGIYLKITKCINESSEYQEGLGIRMNYTIDSIDFL